MGRRRKTKRELERLSNMEPRQMGRGALEHHWNRGGCTHPAPTVTMYGLCAVLSCDECGKSMQFLLKFGRPKTMDVTIYDDRNDASSARPVGRATMGGSRDMIHSHAVQTFMPAGGADPEGGAPARDRMMLGILVGVLMPMDGHPEQSPGDFAAVWRGIDCDHGNVFCQAFGNIVSLECRDCASDITFEYVGKDRFSARVTRMPLPPDWYGIHDAARVVGALREFTNTIDLPTTMADKMSHDPERDARRLVAVVNTLERYGLLRRLPATDNRDAGIIQVASALSCDRREFAGRCRRLAGELRRKNMGFSAHGKPVSIETVLEAARLAWPCVFEGVGITVNEYDLTGVSEHCVKCGFCTLDDDDVGQEYWERGCPECGYPGYLVELDG